MSLHVVYKFHKENMVIDALDTLSRCWHNNELDTSHFIVHHVRPPLLLGSRKFTLCILRT